MRLDFPPELVELVKSSNDIIEMANEYFVLEQAGNLYRTHCKHEGGDKTPSLTFFADTQTFYCFACGAGERGTKTSGSDIIAFIQWVENIGWQDAVIYLADRCGIKIPQAKLSKEERAKQKLYEKAMTDNRTYWGKLQLNNPDVLAWFHSKGFTTDDIAKWRLGVDQGVPTYAIIDDYGRTVAFSRRLNTKDSKYKNDCNSDIFKKGNILYGLHNIKKLARQLGFIVIVEGFNDVIMLQRYGIPAVAIMGTSLTDRQILLLKKYTRNVILFLDGDQPGVESTLEHIKTLDKEGFAVEVVNISGDDPDDFALQHKEETLLWINLKKKLGFGFMISVVLDKYLDSVMRLKTGAIKDIESILEHVYHGEEREAYADMAYRIIRDERQ